VRPPLRLRLLVPSIALIVAATMIPAALRHPSLRYIESHFEADADFLNNILLYMPLGIALGGSSLLRTLLFGLSLSTAAEILQLGYVDRIPSFSDIVSNTCGAVVGYLVALLWQRLTGHNPRSIKIPRPIAALAILFAILGTISLVRHSPKPDFSNWSPDFHLAIGNELTGDRPWSGTVSELQIYPFALAPAQLMDFAQQASATGNADKAGRASAFSLPAGGLLPPLEAKVDNGHPLLSRQQELDLYDALVKQGRLTLLVALRPSSVEQGGPARIITYSEDAQNRNFTLGQMGNTLTFRLRTPASGPNGTNPALYSGPVLSANHTSFVAAVYDGRTAQLYVDGARVAQADLGARRPHISRRIFALLPGPMPIRAIELGGAEALLSGALSLGVFAFMGVPQRLGMRLLVGAAAGIVIGGAVWIFGVSQPGLGMRILLECIAASCVIAASVQSQVNRTDEDTLTRSEQPSVG
jgi:VanZ family protein